MGSASEEETRQRLLRSVKKEVKQIMEEAVTRKFVHEDSSHIISLCGAVEGCLLHGLRRRAAGFLRSDKTAALFTKLGKVFPPAAELCRKVHEVESRNDRRGHQSLSQDSSKKGGGLGKGGGGGLSPTTLKHVWVRTALFECVLDKIAQYLVDNACKYYEKEALLMDPVDGAILASLLVGPCALEYTKMKTADHFWTDPSADELVQRHRIHSGHSRAESPSKRPALNISLTEQIRKRHSSGSVSDERATLLSARDYVESLHQNSRATLLYGKNNVLVQPKEDTEVIPGYLSLHQTAENLTLKWTPNQLMNGSLGDGELEKSVYWDYAITVHMEDIVYLHCHQQPDNGGTVVLVSQDGVQRPPLHFPQGGHLLAFLSCMENGLLPRGQLDPPLWSQRGKGKVFPKLKRRSCRGRPPDGEGEDEATDYVFRITYPSMRSENVPPDLLELQGGGMQAVLSWQLEGSTRRGSCSCSPAATPPDARSSSLITCAHDRAPLKLLCETMKRQILSRAFYGWLAYCRHLSTVRTHLSALINHDMIPAAGAREGLTPLVWQQYMSDSKSISEEELLRLVYYGGVDHSLRHQVWPYLLGHYKFGMTERERRETDEVTRALYEHTMAEWLACEAIVRQRERESHAAALAKLSSGSSIDSHVRQLIHRDSSISNEVFESVDEVEGSAGRDAAAAAAAAAGTKAGGAVKLGVKRVPDSPDSGLPSSRNFSLASSSRGTTAGSFSLDDNGTEGGGGGGGGGSRDPAADKDKEPAPDCADGAGSGGDGRRREGAKTEEEEAAARDDAESAVEAAGEAEAADGGDASLRAGDGAGADREEAAPKTPGGASGESAGGGGGALLDDNVEGWDESRDIEDIIMEAMTEEVEEEAADGVGAVEAGSGGGSGEALAERDAAAKAVAGGSELAAAADKTTAEDTEELASTGAAPAGDAVNRAAGREGSGSEEQRARCLGEVPRLQRQVSQGEEEEEEGREEPQDDAFTRDVVVVELVAGEAGGSSTPPATGEAVAAPAPATGASTSNNLDAPGVLPCDAVSPASSTGATYTTELLDTYALNLHRIEKDVQRCDRNFWYFTAANLDKLRNIMCSYVWEHLEVGYVQGMCDILAPLLVILDDEALAYSCFTEMMKRMTLNFPHGGVMDTHFANMRSLIQILDPEMFELMVQNGDYTHFYFCYRWFLLDFKRELLYDDVFAVWEVIWAARRVSSAHFVLFIALAMVELYRDIILHNSMDFTDIIKFFNEMAEHHDAQVVLRTARELVNQVQTLVVNK
ncbi:small G protein signaling modulator 2-like isoform X4 [Lethenteron reissneri]|uniref:small G protein signaling modulator 2-like isoform X4 n=1 Tax=Lethenteron reissneri TaxID=7753 RepID=UPI002AB666D6|nr:small G protein signaling modulator 2-like isoform X4 [Lethenteron reissneri]